MKLKIILFFTLFYSISHYSQDFEYWTDYLNGNEVTAVLEHGDFVYIGTKRGGVVIHNKITGEQTYYNINNSELPSNHITCVAEDNYGNIWFGAAASVNIISSIKGGLVKYDGSNWEAYTTANTGVFLDQINSLVFDNNNNLWIGNGMLSAGNSLIKYDGTTWTVFDDTNSPLPDSHIEKVTIDDNNTKWIGTYGGGLFKYDDTNWEVYNTSNSNITSNTIYDIAIDSNGTKWIATGDNLVSFDGTNWFVSSTFDNLAVSVIIIDDNDNKWVTANSYMGAGVAARGYGIVKYVDDTNYTQYLLNNSGIAHNDVWTIDTNSNGDILIGTGHGLSIFDGVNWNRINTSQVPVYNDFTLSSLNEFAATCGLGTERDALSVTSFSEDSNGNLWCGITNIGLLKFDGNSWIVYNENNSSLPADIQIGKIAIDMNDNIWFGTLFNGIGMFDGNSFHLYNSSNSGFPSDSNGVYGEIVVDNNNSIWFGVKSSGCDYIAKGLVKYDGTNWHQYNETNSNLPNNDVKSIAIDSNNIKWFASGNNVVKFDETNWTIYNSNNSGLPDKPVHQVRLDSNDVKWIVAGGFLSGGSELIEFDETNVISHGSAPETIHGLTLAIDNNNNKWFANNNLTKYDGINWHDLSPYNSPLTFKPVKTIFIDNNNAAWISLSDVGFEGISTFKENEPSYTYVPDDNFEQKLIDLGYDDVLDNYVLTNNIKNVTLLEIWSSNISDLTGIEDFTNLEILRCSNNNISSVDLSNNTHLTWLTISNNNLSSIDLSNNTLISTLYLDYNNITDLDLTQNTSLWRFYCRGNGMTSIDLRNGTNTIMDSNYVNFTYNPNLNCIFVDDANYSSTHWTNIDANTHFVETQAECDALINQTTYVPDDNFENYLETHDAQGNPIPVGDTSSMGNGIANDDYVFTSRISNVTTLNVDGRSITDLTGIEDFTGLTKLVCWNNTISSLDVSNNIYLRELSTSGNPIGSLNVSQNTQLEILYCSYNQLSTLDISNNPNLRLLGCSNNNLSSLDVSQNPNLTYLVLNDNNLTSINVVNLTLLRHFMFNNNQISDIDISQNTALTGFFCENNLLTEINLSQNQNIYRFDCSGNALLNLNIKNTDYLNFTTFDATNNPDLTCVFVDDANYMNTNWSNAIDATATYVETQSECDALNIDESFKASIQVYPNPFKDKIAIKVTDTAKIKSISIQNMQGQVVYKGDYTAQVNLANLPAGMYLLNIEDQQGNQAVFKLMKN